MAEPMALPKSNKDVIPLANELISDAEIAPPVISINSWLFNFIYDILVVLKNHQLSQKLQ